MIRVHKSMLASYKYTKYLWLIPLFILEGLTVWLALLLAILFGYIIATIFWLPSLGWTGELVIKLNRLCSWDAEELSEQIPILKHTLFIKTIPPQQKTRPSNAGEETNKWRTKGTAR